MASTLPLTIHNAHNAIHGVPSPSSQALENTRRWRKGPNIEDSASGRELTQVLLMEDYSAYGRELTHDSAYGRELTQLSRRTRSMCVAGSSSDAPCVGAKVPCTADHFSHRVFSIKPPVHHALTIHNSTIYTMRSTDCLIG